MIKDAVNKIPEKQIIVCEKVNFAWTKQQINECKTLWKNGYSVPEIAKAMNRKTEDGVFEILALCYHMIMTNRIQPREGKMWGFEQ